MHSKGLTKLSEECGELVTVCQKFIALRDQVGLEAVEHWDGSNMLERLSEEAADVVGAIRFVCKAFDLDEELIHERSERKENLFLYWSNGGEKTKPTTSEVREFLESIKHIQPLVYEGEHERRPAGC